MIAKMFAWVLVMIAGLTGFVMAVTVYMATGDMYILGGILGLVVGVLGLVQLLKINKAYQEKAYEDALKNPEEILVKWEVDGVSHLITKRALFVNKRFYPFVTYQRLSGLRQTQKDGQHYLVFSFHSTIAQTHPPDMAIPIPADLKKEITQVQRWLTNSYLS